jgi:hypothetical protein
MFANRNRDKGWFITLFGPKIAEECYNFYKHIQGLTLKPMEPESFSLRMVMGFLVCPMMQTSLIKVNIEHLTLKANSGHVSFPQWISYHMCFLFVVFLAKLNLRFNVSWCHVQR